MGESCTRAAWSANQRHSNGWSRRLSTYQPTDTTAPTIAAPERPAAPQVAGNVRIAAFNLENLFNGDGRGGGFPTERGAKTPQALDAPHFVNRFGTMEVEKGRAPELAAALADMGFEVEEATLASGLHGIVITPEGLEGGADPRREGIVIGG